MKIVLDGLVESISSRADGSVKIVFGTQEMDPKQAGDLFQLRGKYSKLLMSDSNITHEEEIAVDETSIKDGKKKTKSARLRNIIYVVWNMSALKNKMPFEVYYNTEMERLIDEFKAKLEQNQEPEENGN